MLEIPLQQLPAQSFITILDEQNVEISLYQRYDRLYMDVTLDETQIAAGCVCLNYVPVIQHETDFRGALIFADTLGDTAPQWDGLGENGRYVLFYLTQTEAEEYGFV